MLLIATLGVAVIAGCKNGDSQVVGDWKDSSGKVTSFKADKTVTQGSGATLVAGKWSLDDKVVSIEIDTIGGKPADQFIDQFAKMLKPDQAAKAKEMLKSVKFKLSDDGKSLALQAPEGQKVPAGANPTLTKVQSAGS